MALLQKHARAIVLGALATNGGPWIMQELYVPRSGSKSFQTQEKFETTCAYDVPGRPICNEMVARTLKQPRKM